MDFKTFFRTDLEKFGFYLLVFALLSIPLFLYRQFHLALVCMIIAGFLFHTFYKLICEEMVILRLKENEGQLLLDRIIEEFPSVGKIAVDRLQDKNIVDVKERMILLKNKHIVTTFETWSSHLKE